MVLCGLLPCKVQILAGATRPFFMEATVARTTRADILVAEQGLTESREMAKRLIMAGKVGYVSPGSPEGTPSIPVSKPGQPFSPQTRFVLTGIERFVSRGAYKLLTALEAFAIGVEGFTCLDIGASTGGFTDCLLQHGAARVYAVDVGQAQLHERLQADPRVVSHEGVNVRTAPAGLIPEPVDMLVGDVSFISLTQVLPNCMQWLKQGAHIVVLVKPQFELGSGKTVKGVVRDEALQQEAVDKVLGFCQDQLGLRVVGVLPAAIKGPKGNQEYVAYLRLDAVADACKGTVSPIPSSPDTL